MRQNNLSERDPLGFLNSFPSDKESIELSGGRTVEVKKYFLKFKVWKGAPIPNTYGNKTVINFNNEPLFAELVILKLFQMHGWDGVWVDSYRKKYRVGLPDVVKPINIPDDKQKLVDNIRSQTGSFGGCWDVVVWKDDQTLFIELKRAKKDRVQGSQKYWLDASLKYGLSARNFCLVEWDLHND